MSRNTAPPPKTPDGRYIVVDGVLWRATDPRLDEDERQAWVKRLMSARRAVRDAKRADDPEALQAARNQVHDAKVALGERGPVWWDDDQPDLTGKRIQNTPYRDWWHQRSATGGDATD